MREINLNRLMLFRAVVSTGSFSKAAQQLKMPKSKISRQISTLEEEMGVALIYRTTRSFQLTDAGKELFQRALPLMSELEGVLQNLGRAQQEMQGPLKLTVPEDIGVELMAGFCHEFNLMHPRIKLDLLVDNRSVDLVKEGVDLALRIARSKDSTLTCKKVGAISLSLYAGATLFQRHAHPHRLEELTHLPYLSFFGSQPQSLKLRSQRSSIGLKVEPAFTCNNFFVLKKMALLGHGFTLLPSYLVQQEILQGELVPLFKDWRHEEVPVQLLYPHQKNMPPRLRILIDFMARRLGERFA